MRPMKINWKSASPYARFPFLVIALMLGGCFEDETTKKPLPPQPPPQVTKPVTPTPQPSPLEQNPVVEHWTEIGQQALDGKKCSTWWVISKVSPDMYWTTVKTSVSDRWPKTTFQSDGATSARYQVTVGKNAFDEDRTAQIQLALSDPGNGTMRVDWRATVNADDQISATDILRAEAEQVWRLLPATDGVLPGRPQSPSASIPQLLFPLGVPDRPDERYEPQTVPMTSVFDHSMAFRFEEGKVNTADYGVTAFTGESATEKDQMVVEMEVNDPILGKKTPQKLYEFRSKANKYLNGYNYAGSTLAYDGHPGYDFSAPKGTPVYAAAAGKIVWAGEKDLGDGAGLYVRILHDGGYITQYLHLSTPAQGISIGTQVKKGQLIGRSGNTGTGTGPHLHFEVKKNCNTNGEGGVSIDPYGWTGEPGKDPYKLDGDGDSVWMWETGR